VYGMTETDQLCDEQNCEDCPLIEVCRLHNKMCEHLITTDMEV